MITGFLNAKATVYRPDTSLDEVGGQTVTRTAVGTVAIQVSQPSAQEHMFADRWGGRLTHVAHVLPTADVERGDELEVSGDLIPRRGRLRVLAVSGDSRATYRRLELEADHAEEGSG